MFVDCCCLLGCLLWLCLVVFLLLGCCLVVCGLGFCLTILGVLNIYCSCLGWWVLCCIWVGVILGLLFDCAFDSVVLCLLDMRMSIYFSV